MTLSLEPNYTVLTFFMIQRFGFFAFLVALTGLRLIGGRGIARLPALIAFVLALGGLLTAFAPALGLSTSPLYALAAQGLARGDGMIALVVPSAIFATSLLFPTRRWSWIDLVHLAGVAALLGLWWWVMW